MWRCFLYTFGSHLLREMQHFGTIERGPWTDEIRALGQPLDIYYRNPYHQLQPGLFYLPPLPHGPDMHVLSIDESASSQAPNPWTEPTGVGDHIWRHTPGLPEAPAARAWLHENTNPEARLNSRRRRGYPERYYHSPSSLMTGTNDHRYCPDVEGSPQQSYPPTPHRSPRQWQSEQESDASHMQMVRYRPDARDDRTSSSRHRENPYYQEEHIHEDSSTTFPGSPNWPTSTNHDSGRLLASQDTGSGYSPASMATSSSGYVDSYDVRSDGSYNRDYEGGGGYEDDSDGMSDGIASDEGVYDSSSSNRGDFEDDGEVYSDYSSDEYSASESDDS